MKNLATAAIGVLIVLAAGLVGYWFWVPDVSALRTWDEFLSLPAMECSISDASVEGLAGSMYVGSGRLRADYTISGQGISSAFHTVVYEDGTAYTWSDTIPYAEKSVFNLAGASTESNLFKIARCKRVWTLDPELFLIPVGREFTNRDAVSPQTE